MDLSRKEEKVEGGRIGLESFAGLNVDGKDLREDVVARLKEGEEENQSLESQYKGDGRGERGKRETRAHFRHDERPTIQTSLLLPLPLPTLQPSDSPAQVLFDGSDSLLLHPRDAEDSLVEVGGQIPVDPVNRLKELGSCIHSKVGGTSGENDLELLDESDLDGERGDG